MSIGTVVLLVATIWALLVGIWLVALMRLMDKPRTNDPEKARARRKAFEKRASKGARLTDHHYDPKQFRERR